MIVEKLVLGYKEYWESKNEIIVTDLQRIYYDNIYIVSKSVYADEQKAWYVNYSNNNN